MNVDEDERAYDALIARRLRTVPVTFIEGRAIKGYDPDALRQALDDFNILRPKSPPRTPPR